MRRERKNKKLKKIVFIGILLIVLIAIIVVLIQVFGKKESSDDGAINLDEEQREIYTLPETKYSGMEVTNVEMEYLKEDSSTMVSMRIINTTNSDVKNENFNAVLMNSNGDRLGVVPTSIESIEAGGVYDVSVIIRGDLTSTTQIKLEKQS